MPGRVTILQISDLHRDPRNPIGNDALLTSLANDRRRYVAGEPTISSPDIVVVSGDVIQGAAPGTANFGDVLAEQHAEALRFLVGLAEEFVHGRRDRVVIVPGNHDVSACHVMASLNAVEIAPDRRGNLVAQLFSQGSSMRWSWQELGLFEIADATRYAERMAPFAAFYENFYEGRRRFDLDPAKQFDIFDFPEFDLTIVGFCSCYTNDILNKQGAIHPSCIGSVGRILRGTEFAGRLRLAVWHHSTEGSPTQADYMDPEILQNLIDCGFSIGLHGHQHKPQFLDTRFRYGTEARITVISAGTLCGSSSPRFGRAYNTIELDTTDCTGRLHVREMQNDNLQLPIWGARAFSSTTTPYVAFRFSPPPEPLVEVHAVTAALLEAQRLMEEHAFREAATLLQPLVADDDLARRLRLDCLGHLHDTESIVQYYDPPRSEVEALYLMDALWAERHYERLRAILAEPLVVESSDAAVVDVRTKYAARLK